MKACRDFRRLLPRYFDGRLAIDEEFHVEQHVGECDMCRALFEKDELLREGLLNLPSPPVERLDIERSLERIHAAIDAGAGDAVRTGSHRWRIVAGLAAAAAVVAAAWPALFGGGQGEPTDGPAVAETNDESGTPDEVVVPELVEATPTNDPLARFEFPLLDVGPSELDSERLSRAKSAVRGCLERAAVVLEGEAGEAPGAGERFALRFDELAAPLEATDWPVAFIATKLVDDTNPTIARAAARYVGLRGARGSEKALVSALVDPDRKWAATLALVDAGPRGWPGLTRAVWDPELAELVRERVSRFSPEDGVAWIELALDRVPRGVDPESARDVVALLSGFGEEGAVAQLRLDGHRAVDRAWSLDGLATTESAEDVLRDAIESEHLAYDAELLLEAVGRLHPEDTEQWVIEQCHDARTCAVAARVLATFDGRDVVEALLEIELTRRLDDDDFMPAWKLAVEHDAKRLTEVAWGFIEEDKRYEQRFLLELLVMSESPQAVPAILALVGNGAVADAERERALLAILELGNETHLDGLRWLFNELGAGDRKLAAACLYVIHSLGEVEETDPLLTGLSEKRRVRVLEHLESAGDRRGPALTLYHLARELEPVLVSREQDPWRSTQ